MAGFTGLEKSLGFLKDWVLLVFPDWIKSVSDTKVSIIPSNEEYFRLNDLLFRSMNLNNRLSPKKDNSTDTPASFWVGLW